MIKSAESILLSLNPLVEDVNIIVKDLKGNLLGMSEVDKITLLRTKKYLDSILKRLKLEELKAKFKNEELDFSTFVKQSEKVQRSRS